MLRGALTFSWRRLLGITAAKRRIGQEIGIPLTKTGIERKIGRTILKLFGL
jgi:hypothetical protein